MTKRWYFSKTLWIGILEFLGGLFTALAGQLATGGIITIAGIITIVLRLLTKSKIGK